MTVRDNEKDIQMLKEISAKLTKMLTGNGDGIGMDEDVRNIKRDVKVMSENYEKLTGRVGRIESDTKEMKRMLRDAVGYAGVKFNERNHPGRRSGDKPQEGQTWLKKAWDRTTENIFDKVILAIIILVIANFPSFLEMLINLLK